MAERPIHLTPARSWSGPWSIFSSRRLGRQFILDEIIRFATQVNQAAQGAGGGRGSGLRLLDIGCGERPYERLFHADYVGVDLNPRPTADALARAERLPFRDESFDVAVCTQVLEHVLDPGSVLQETRRVLRKEGLFFLSTHGVWLEKHEAADYWRWTLDGLTRILTAAGFEILRTASMNPSASLMQLLCFYFPVRWYPVHTCFNLLGSALGRTLGPRGPRIYLDHAIVCRKP